MNPNKVQIEDSWKEVLRDEFSKPYFDQIKTHLIKAKTDKKIVYPPGSQIFNAFNTTSFSDVKVVIMGQDPYHGPGEAMGLSFSVPKGKRIPPSLRNIYKEIHTDIGAPIPTHGDLTKWANQGVLLLNAILTVEHKSASSHKNIGWETFTDAVITTISKKKENIIFLLWGRFAQSKSQLIDETRHHILQAPHPSPLARGGFFNCKHFSKTNDILTKLGYETIDWEIS